MTYGLNNRLTEYSDAEFASFLRHTFAQSTGISGEALGKPVVGIVNTYSEFNPCHREVPALIAAVKRGVWQSGGLPLEFPVISLGEAFLHPTSMYLRNLMSMDVEAMLTTQPLDSVVLVGGCDKTIPALLMGAASASIPAVVLATGPMLTGSFEGERIGACTDCRRFWAEYRQGTIGRNVIDDIESQLAPTAGTCGVMGTASTMACVTEALGMMLPGGATIPAVYAGRLRHAEATGRYAMRLIEHGLTPDRIMTKAAFDNALRVLLAIGGSTNGIIHLTAIAGRLGIKLSLDRLNDLSDTTPVLVHVRPSGAAYMEDFHRAGGLPVVMRELQPLLHLDCLTVTNATWRALLDDASEAPAWQSVIRPLANPFQPQGALVAVKGSLAPDGALIKRSAASPELFHTTGRAVVFRSLDDLHRRIDDPALDVRPEDILVLQNAGPIGGMGMPEAGALPIPRKLKGVKDMLRISDARMSGTAFGTIVLHVSPEAAVGGALGIVQDGDMIEFDLDRRQLELKVDDREIERRRAAMTPPQLAARGYQRLYQQSIQQAHLGADFSFLRHAALVEAQ